MRKIILVFLLSVWWGGSVFSQTVDSGNFRDTIKDKESQIIEYLEFREVDIKDVLRQLAKQYNLNIVFSEGVKGLVTVQLHHVSVKEALDSIITVNGFAYTRKDNVIKVTTPEEAEKEGRRTKLFRLNNADATQLKDTIKKVLSKDGKVEADKRSNSLVVTDYPSVINMIEDMLPNLDRITPQVLIEARFIETSLTKTEQLGINWTAQITASGSKRPTTFPFNRWGSDKDMYPVPSYSSDTTYEKYPWAASGSSNPNDYYRKTTITSDFPFREEGSSYRLGSFPMAEATEFAFGILDFSQFMGVLNFLKQRQDSRVIANPRITTIDNKEASINVGKVIPLANYTYNDTTGTWEITGWDEYNVGISLKVTPHVSPDGHIKLKLHPEVSSIIDWIGQSGDLNRRPVTSTRTAETEIQIRDGQTVVIGGLIKNNYSHMTKKVPFLGDLPLVGKLFTYNEKGTEEEPTERVDLLIFVTAHILKDTDKPLIGNQRGVLTSEPKPFKMSLRKIKF